MLNENHISAPEVSAPLFDHSQYMECILRFFVVVLTKFLAVDPLEPSILHIAACIFDQERELHTQVIPWYTSNEILYFDRSNTTEKKRVEGEREWRLSEVKPGIKVDVIRQVKVDKEYLRCWQRGTVLAVGLPESPNEEEDQIEWDKHDPRLMQEVQIKLSDLSDHSDRSFYLNIMDGRYAPVGTFTDDYEWRCELKVGDLVDAVDNEFDWYKALVL
jgi:hypothetical protein